MNANDQPILPVTQHTSPPKPPSRTGVRLALAGTLIGIVVLGGFIGVRVKESKAKQELVATERVEAQAAATKKPAVLATKPKAATYKPRIEVTGTLNPWRDADLSFEIPGKLTKLNVALGDSVKQGQVLGVLDSVRAGDMVAIKDATARAAAATLAIAEDNLRRTNALLATKSIAEAQAENAKQQVDLARAGLQAAQSDARFVRNGASQLMLVAPFAGLVTRAPTSAGSVVSPAAPLIHLEDLSRLRLSATVTEEEAPLVALGQKVSINYRDRVVTGKVITIIPSLDAATRRAPIEIEIPNDEKAPVFAHGFVRATIEAGSEVPAVRVPSTARRPGSQSDIVKVVDGKAKIVQVVHAVAEDGTWVVRSGLSADDVILLSPTSEVKDGDVIEGVELR